MTEKTDLEKAEELAKHCDKYDRADQAILIRRLIAKIKEQEATIKGERPYEYIPRFYKEPPHDSE